VSENNLAMQVELLYNGFVGEKLQDRSQSVMGGPVVVDFYSKNEVNTALEGAATAILFEAEAKEGFGKLETYLMDEFPTEVREGELLIDTAIRLMKQMKRILLAGEAVFSPRTPHWTRSDAL